MPEEIKIRMKKTIRERLQFGFLPRLIGLVVLTALLAGGVVGMVLIQNGRNVLREEILESNLANADLAAQFAASYIEGAETNLRQFATRPLFIRAVLEKDLTEAEMHLAQFMEIDKRFDSISVYDAKGIGWASGLKDKWQNRGGSVADREWFQQTISTGKPYLGIPVLSRATGRPVVAFTIPLFDDKEEINAVLAGGISLAALSDTITGIVVSPSARTSLLDSRQGGIILAHPDKERILTAVTGQNTAALRAIAGERGTMETRSSSGELDLAAFAPVPGLPWSVLILEPVEAAYAPLNSLTAQATLYTTMIMLIAAMLGLLLARTITGPMQRLMMGTEEIGRGNLEYRIEVTARDEIGQLSRAFNRMTEDLRAITASRDELNREIAERKRAEEALKKIMSDLERSNRELQQFAYVASHDLQEPLRMVASFVQLLAERYKGKLDSEADEFIGYAVDGANLLQNMINDLLEYSRVESRGKLFESTDCEAVLEQVLMNLKFSIEESGATVTHDPLPKLYADAPQLMQLFQNLISNAIKFRGKETPRIHICAERQEKEWLFSVRDNGIGIDLQYKDRIFVIFQRLHGREYPGTGIGLAVCKRIVERHGGKIWVESKPEEGSTFYMTMPIKGGEKQ